LACEIFTCEIDAIFSTLLDDSGELFALLFSLLDAPPPLNPVLAGYFSKVMCAVLGRRAMQALALLQRRPRCLEALLRHVGSTSCAEVLHRLVGADDGPLAGHPDAQAWLCASPLLGKLLDALGPDATPSTQANAADVLSAIARTAPCDLATSLAAPPSLGRLFSQGLLCGGGSGRGGRGLSHALDVALALMDPRPPRTPEPPPGANAPERREGAAEPSRMAGAALPHFSSLVARLSRPADAASSAASAALPTAWGSLRPPLGMDRLKIVEFLSAMLRTGSPPVREAYMRLGVLGHCLELFAAYPFHTLLHSAVEAQVAHALSGSQPELARHACAPAPGGAALLARVAGMHVTLPQAGPAWALAPRLPGVGAPAETPANGRPPPGPPTGPRPLRAGYMGYVVRIGNRIAELSAAPGYAWLADAVAGDARWGAYVAGPLRACADAQAGGRWACGRPSRGNSDGGDEEEDEDDDDDDDGGGGGGRLSVDNTAAALKLNRDVYHRYDAFGDDDDDDEDEEEDEDDDDRGGGGGGARRGGGGGGGGGGAASGGGGDSDEDGGGGEVFSSWEQRADGSIDLGSLRLGAPASAAGGAGGSSPPSGSPTGSPSGSPMRGARRGGGVGGEEEDDDTDAPTPDGLGDDDDVIIGDERDGAATSAPVSHLHSSLVGGYGSSLPPPPPPPPPPYDASAFWRAGYDATLTADDV
jgi:serine/threonine-protein phosphatase 6 regulatory subunit 3